MQQIEVTKTMPASPDGININTYEAGTTYSMPDDLAKVFLREGWGKAPEPTPQEAPMTQTPANKVATPASAPAETPANKMAAPAKAATPTPKRKA